MFGNQTLRQPMFSYLMMDLPDPGTSFGNTNSQKHTLGLKLRCNLLPLRFVLELEHVDELTKESVAGRPEMLPLTT
jgi:hypothetical protein